MKDSITKKEHFYNKTWIILSIIVAIAIMIAFIAFFASRAEAIGVAYLHIESGTVEVNQGNNWEKAIDGMSLSLNDRIKTLDDSEASIIIYDSIITSLESNTEISIQVLKDDFVKLEQSKGSTWNKFIGLAGLKGMEVETPTTVATVRGTEFGIDITDAEESLMVAEGKVLFGEKATKTRMTAVQGEKLMLARQVGQRLTQAKTIADEAIQPQTGNIIKVELTNEDKERMIERVVKTVDRIKLIRENNIQTRENIRDRLIQRRTDIKDLNREVSAKMIVAGEEAEQLPAFAIEEKLNLLVALDKDVLDIMEQKAAEGNIRAERLMALKEIRETQGMEKINRINDRLNQQLDLIEELRAKDEDMKAAVETTLQKEEFRNIIEPLTKAGQETRDILIEEKIISEDTPEQRPELQKIMRTTPINEPNFRIIENS